MKNLKVLFTLPLATVAAIAPVITLASCSKSEKASNASSSISDEDINKINNAIANDVKISGNIINIDLGSESSFEFPLYANIEGTFEIEANDICEFNAKNKKIVVRHDIKEGSHLVHAKFIVSKPNWYVWDTQKIHSSHDFDIVINVTKTIPQPTPVDPSNNNVTITKHVNEKIDVYAEMQKLGFKFNPSFTEFISNNLGLTNQAGAINDFLDNVAPWVISGLFDDKIPEKSLILSFNKPCLLEIKILDSNGNPVILTLKIVEKEKSDSFSITKKVGEKINVTEEMKKLNLSFGSDFSKFIEINFDLIAIADKIQNKDEVLFWVLSGNTFPLTLSFNEPCTLNVQAFDASGNLKVLHLIIVE
ncbi:MAG: hypothetical protein LBF02_00395 [Mycoplasmataceae bacterium]|nr:hypothetical protein [Mycoplasmataceae bacterium]